MRGNCWKRRAARCWSERESGEIPAIGRSYLERVERQHDNDLTVVSGMASPYERFPEYRSGLPKASLRVPSRTTENRDPSHLPPQPGERIERNEVVCASASRLVGFDRRAKGMAALRTWRRRPMSCLRLGSERNDLGLASAGLRLGGFGE